MKMSSHNATPPSTPTPIDDESQISQLSSFAPLSFRQSMVLARKMRTDLLPRTKDRKWRLKSYSNCFKATHALSWASDNISSDETIAVIRLNQLVDHGLLTHVVDPYKKFRLGETRTLYFRMVHAILDADMAEEVDFLASPGTAIPIISGAFGSSMNAVGGNNIDEMQKRLNNIDHLLQETMKELNDSRGKLEVVQQEVLTLVSQQTSTFVMMTILNIYLIVLLVTSTRMGWFSALGLAITMILSTRCGLRCISLWSDVDSQTSIPMETISIMDGNNSLAEGSIVRFAKSFERKPSSITAMISKSLKSVTGVSTKSLKRSLSITEKPIICMREEYSLPDVNTWKHGPLLICANSAACPNLKVPKYGLESCPLGIPFKFSSELFEGTCLIRLKGSKSDDPEGDSEYFVGKKRIFQCVTQGRFKEEMLVSDVTTGHEFAQPLKNLPHPFILKTATNFIGKVSPGANIVVHTDQPFVEATLGGTSQVVRGDEPGNEPNITCGNIQEDCSVFGGVFAKGNVSTSRRKRLFSNPAKCKEYTFDTETVYTFEFYQNLFDAQSYSLDLGFAKLGCASFLNGQPIQWLGKTRDGRYLWSFQIWHEKLLSNSSDKSYR